MITLPMALEQGAYVNGMSIAKTPKLNLETYC